MGSIAAGTAAGVLALALLGSKLLPARDTAGSPPAQAPVSAPAEPSGPDPGRDPSARSGAPSAASSAHPDEAALQALIEQEAHRLPGKARVHVRVEVPGAEPGREIAAGVNADLPAPAASVIKLPLMAIVEDRWHTGAWDRTAEDVERVREMITHSDNPAADALMGRVGFSQANRWLDLHGLPRTRLHHRIFDRSKSARNQVTAAEMTGLLLQIARGELVSPAASREMREILLAQTRRQRIPAGLPDGVTVGNKTGTLRGLVHDVAFVEPADGPRYALAVLLTEAGPESRANAAIARLSREVYQFLVREPDEDKEGMRIKKG